MKKICRKEVGNVASELYEQMEKEMEDLSQEFFPLMNEFRKTGDDELFIELYSKLLRLEDKAYYLEDPEEKYEIIRNASTLRGIINSLSHSAF